MRTRSLVVVALALLVASCGSETPTAPSIAQVAGVYTGSLRTTAVTGGECLGAALQGSIGTSSPITASFTQNGAAISATIASQATGLNCSLSGTADSSTIALTLTSCQAGNFSVACGTGGRLALVVGGSATGTASGSTITGTYAQTYNVQVNVAFGAPVGVMTVNSAFTLTR